MLPVSISRVPSTLSSGRSRSRTGVATPGATFGPVAAGLAT
jgi:hypothetical protein